MALSQVIVHESYTTIEHRNDIALLRTSMKAKPTFIFKCSPLGERVDLFLYPPACLPSEGQSFEGQPGKAYGEFEVWEIKKCPTSSSHLPCLGWGNTGVYASDTLLEVQVCIEGIIAYQHYTPSG